MQWPHAEIAVATSRVVEGHQNCDCSRYMVRLRLLCPANGDTWQAVNTVRWSDSGTLQLLAPRLEVLASTIVVDDAVLDDQLFFCEWMEVAFRSKICASQRCGIV